jgi:hypothetical protein
MAQTKAVRKRKIARLRLIVSRYKRDKCCIKCQESSAPMLLEFHHRNPATKIRTVSRAVAVGWSIRSLTNEIRKCVLVCRECHVETHIFLRIFGIS